MTDDGVKAATNVMAAITGVEGSYDARANMYRPPAGYRDWEAVVLEFGLRIEVEGRVRLYA